MSKFKIRRSIYSKSEKEITVYLGKTIFIYQKRVFEPSKMPYVGAMFNSRKFNHGYRPATGKDFYFGTEHWELVIHVGSYSWHLRRDRKKQGVLEKPNNE